MRLIGGRVVDGELRRDARLAELSGAAELLAADLAESALPQPARVSRFLAATLAEVGGRPLDQPAADALSVGDRQYLVRQVGAALGRDRIWLTRRCTACGAGFDIPVAQAALPVKAAGASYPEAEVVLRGRTHRLRVPTGADQAAIAHLPEAAAADALLDRLLDPAPDGPLTPDERDRLDAVLEDMAPEVALEAQAHCPDCGAENRVAVDPYLTLALADLEILEEVHVLARRYHWSEAEILALPRGRRKRYLGLIDRERGMVGPDSVPAGLGGGAR